MFQTDLEEKYLISHYFVTLGIPKVFPKYQKTISKLAAFLDPNIFDSCFFNKFH